MEFCQLECAGCPVAKRRSPEIREVALPALKKVQQAVGTSEIIGMSPEQLREKFIEVGEIDDDGTINRIAILFASEAVNKIAAGRCETYNPTIQ